MLAQRLPIIGRCAILLLPLVLAACARQPLVPQVEPPRVRATPVDFSGFWEIDLARSDDVQTQLNRVFRGMSRPQRNGPSRLDNRSRTININTSSSSIEAIIALARLAEEITRTPVLEIQQDEEEIAIEREEEYSLNCGFYDYRPQVVETPFGNEICGWNGEQLVFHVTLPGGLTVTHRMTMAPDKQTLHVATTVASTTAPTPFTMSQFYNRYEPPESDYDCQFTLSKRKVCSPRRSGL